MNPVYIYQAKRTPIGKQNGQYKHLLPEHLMALVIKDLISGLDPHLIDDVIIANAVGPLGNLARLSWLSADLPITTPATSIDFQCGGGLKAVELAFYQIGSGQAQAMIAGGVESTSLEPQRFYHPRDPRKDQVPGPLPRAQFSPVSLGDVDMLEGAEKTAQALGFTRQQLDDYALTSHQRANLAHEAGYYTSLVTPVNLASGLARDENLRPSMSLKLLQRAKPLLSTQGLTTAGNACLMHDGAAGLLMGNQAFGQNQGLSAMVQVLGFKAVGCDPTLSPMGPIYAVEALLKDHHLTLADIAFIEINEAFASKVLAFHQATGYPLDKINPQGGALAYGHPYAASGAIYLAHLIKHLSGTNHYGIVTLGVAGGQGIACLVRGVSHV